MQVNASQRQVLNLRSTCIRLATACIDLNRPFHGFRRHPGQQAKWFKIREFVWKFVVKHL